jgi:hypothetical protein
MEVFCIWLFLCVVLFSFFALFGIGSYTSIVSLHLALRLLGRLRSISLDRGRSNVLPASC